MEAASIQFEAGPAPELHEPNDAELQALEAHLDATGGMQTVLANVSRAAIRVGAMRHRNEPLVKKKTGSIFRDDEFNLMLDRIVQVPLLTAEEEVDLAKRIEKGDLAAKEHLVKANVLLVADAVLGFTRNPGNLAKSDLFQIGCEGLMRSTEKFDYRRGYKFSTYATWWIKQSLQRGTADTGFMRRIPVNVAADVSKVVAATRSLELKLGRDPTDDEVAQAARVKAADVQKLLKVDAESLTNSLDAPLNTDSDTSFGEVITDARPDTEDIAVSHEVENRQSRALKAAFKAAGITALEARVVYLRQGGSMEVKDVADDLKLTKDEVKSIERQAMKKLRGLDPGHLEDLRQVSARAIESELLT